MKINSVTTNYSQPKQVSHKGYIKLGNPLGPTMTRDPRAITGLESHIIHYPVCNGKHRHMDTGCCIYGYDYLVHFVEVTKVIFENSTHFWVNAKEDDVQKAVTKAINLPNGEGVTVGEPLAPLLFRQGIGVYNDYYKDLNYDNVEEWMNKYPNTVRIETFKDETGDIPYKGADDRAQALFEDTGKASGRCETRIADVIMSYKTEPDETEY